MTRKSRTSLIMLGVSLIVCCGLADGRGGGGRGGGGGGGGRGGGGGGRVGGGGGGVVSRPSAPSRPISSYTGGARPSTLPSGGGPLHGGSSIGDGGKSWSGPGAVGGDSGPRVIGGDGGKAIVGGRDGVITLPGGKDIAVDGDRGRGDGPIGRDGALTRPDGKIAGKGAAGDMGLARYSKGTVRTGTAHISRDTLVRQRDVVSRDFHHYNCFGPGWWGRYPNAWRAAAWTTAAIVWRACTWNAFYDWCSYPEEPVYYDYGTNIVYEGDEVYVNGAANGTVEQYEDYASNIAAEGKTAEATEKEEWLPLGVFGMVQGEETSANLVVQLAVNKGGVLRGNYYNALEDTTLPVYGKVDPKFRTAAWTVGDKKTPVYEAGIANLTKDATTIMVHFGEGRSQQWNLIRLDQPEEKKE